MNITGKNDIRSLVLVVIGGIVVLGIINILLNPSILSERKASETTGTASEDEKITLRKNQQVLADILKNELKGSAMIYETKKGREPVSFKEFIETEANSPETSFYTLNTDAGVFEQIKMKDKEVKIVFPGSGMVVKYYLNGTNVTSSFK